MSNTRQYQAVWEKFLPVIALKLRAALKKNESQSVGMDKIDFDKASIKKSSKYQFTLEMNEGRTLRSHKASLMALDFARAINEYDPTKELVKTGSFKFTLDSKFNLSIAIVENQIAAVPEAAIAENVPDTVQ